ncbi:MAG: substrate-binding periplasmic protein, partial [Fervidobacterium sp.]
MVLFYVFDLFFTVFAKIYMKRNCRFCYITVIFFFVFFVFFIRFAYVAYGLTLYSYAQDAFPKYFKNGDTIQGLCADIVSELNKELKSKSVSILYKSDRLYTKDEIVNALAKNDIQIFVGFGYVEEDENRGLEYIRFPLYSVRQVFTILKSKKDTASSMGDILKSKIGVIQNTYPERKLSQLFGSSNSKSFVQFETPTEAILALNSGQIGAIFWTSLMHGYYLSAYPEKYDTLNYPGEKFYHYIVVNRSVSSNVKELLYKAIKKINENGTMKKLIRKYKLDTYVLPGNVIEVLTINWKPYEWYDEKDQFWKGIDVDTVKAVFKSLGFEVVFITYPWERCLEFMKSRMFDGIMTLRKTQTREEFLIFPKEILSTGNDVLY